MMIRNTFKIYQEAAVKDPEEQSKEWKGTVVIDTGPPHRNAHLTTK